MSKIYFDKLSALLVELQIENEIIKPIDVKHFFSGAALYVNKTMCASWSPVGLAFKLEEQETNMLIKRGEAIPLKYFPKGHVKKDYALFEDPEKMKTSYWKNFFIKSAQLCE